MLGFSGKWNFDLRGRTKTNSGYAFRYFFKKRMKTLLWISKLNQHVSSLRWIHKLMVFSLLFCLLFEVDVVPMKSESTHYEKICLIDLFHILHEIRLFFFFFFLFKNLNLYHFNLILFELKIAIISWNSSVAIWLR